MKILPFIFLTICVASATRAVTRSTVDCRTVFCPRAPTQEECPAGSYVQKKGCCQCCVDSNSGNCVYDTCGEVNCPFEPIPSACAPGSVLRPDPSNTCCQCCVNTETNECQAPANCTEVNCPLIPTSPQCPSDSVLETKGCCPCCVSNLTGDCVNFLSVCPKKPCPLILPPGRRCPEGSSLNTTIDPQTGCENCPCCVNATGECVPPVLNICPRYACIKPPDDKRICPAGSSWTSRPPNENGCPQCPCCLAHKTKQCVAIISKIERGICPMYACKLSLDNTKMCPAGSSWTSRPPNKNGCTQCPCCLDCQNQCVEPIPACGEVHCPFEPIPSECAPGSVLRPDPSNACCQCCVNTETNECQAPAIGTPSP